MTTTTIPPAAGLHPATSGLRRIYGTGPQPAHVMLVGERPGKVEAEQGRPFCGPTGEALDRYLTTVGLARDRIYLTNLVKDYKDGNPDPTAAEIARDEPLLLAEIARTRPAVIGAVGAFATRYFLGPEAGMDAVHGVPHHSDHGHGLIVPVLHPAGGLYNVDTAALIQDDFQNLMLTVQGRLLPRQDEWAGQEDYRELTTAADFQSVIDAATVTEVQLVRMGTDTEGWRHDPWSVQISVRPGTGYVIRPGTAAMAYFREWLPMALAVNPEFRLLLHNSMHDLEVLRVLGVDLPPNSYTDTMIKAYLLCLEPQGLKDLAYRHAGMRMQEYTEITAAATRAKEYDWLMTASCYSWPPAEEYLIMERDKVTGEPYPKIKKPQSLNRRLDNIVKDLVDKPDTVDIRRRYEQIDWFMRQPIEAAMGEMPVATLSDIDPATAIRYAARDADATLRIDPVLDAKIDAMGLRQVLDIDMAVVPWFERAQAAGMLADPEHFIQLATRCDQIMTDSQSLIQELTGAFINPNSGDQVAELLFDQLSLRPRHLTKSKKRPSTDDKTLESLRRSHPAVPPILDYREASKVKGSFAVVLQQKVNKDGRIRTTLRLTRVSSGRAASSNPNLMAQPVRSDLGKLIRDGFIAGSGHDLSSHDLDQAEMRQMAHESGDPLMCAIFNDTNRDIHRETAAQMFGIDQRDVDKQRHRYPAKRVGFGVITGITGAGLADQMALAGAMNGNKPWEEDDCNRLIIEWFKIYSKAKVYMNECRAEARRTGMTRDCWGRIRYLPGIYSDKSWVREEAERQSHSHKIQAGAQGYLKIGQANLYNRWYGEWWRQGWWIEPLLQIHDELLHEFDSGLWEELDFAVTHELEAVGQDYGYRVPMRAGGNRGKRWGQLKD